MKTLTKVLKALGRLSLVLSAPIWMPSLLVIWCVAMVGAGIFTWLRWIWTGKDCPW